MSAPVRIRIVDEAPGSGRREAFHLDILAEALTVRELIERRVRHEVEAHNLNPPAVFAGLIKPRDAQATTGGWRVAPTRRIDADAQVAGALEAFSVGRILLLVDDRQVDSLDEPVTLRAGTELCFFKLVPLVGG